MTDLPAIAVVVPVRDGADTIVGLLDALASQDRAATQVVVVDDDSGDETVRLVRAHPLAPELVQGDGRGPYAARNAGAHAVAHEVDVIAFTDADCRPDPGWLRALADSMRAGVDLVAGRIVQDLPARPTVWHRYDAATYLDQLELVQHEGFGATANLAIRRDVLEAVGGFDTSLRSSGDLELGRRCRAEGHRLAYAPDAVVHHRPRGSVTEVWRLHRRLGAGWTALARRDGGPTVLDDVRLRPPLGQVVERVGRDGGHPLRRRHLVWPHAVVIAARVTGRVTGR